MKLNQWYVAKTGNDQGLILDEQTGANIAVSYDKTHAPVIASAPTLLIALKAILDSEESTLGDGGSILGDTYREMASAAIAEAEAEQSTRLQTSAESDPDDICPKTSKRHEPDWRTVNVESDGGTFYLDVSCKDCGRSGCIGKAESLADEINW